MQNPAKIGWALCKAGVIAAILASVGWQFARIMHDPSLWRGDFTVRPSWMMLSGAIYLVSLIFPAFFWYGLLHVLGEKPPVLMTLRAYYVGQIGRYVPGKFVGIIVRTNLLHGLGIRNRVAVLTIIYESLTTLASGALLAGIVLTWQSAGGAPPYWKVMGLMLLLAIPICPGVFNFLVKKLAPPAEETNGEVPRIKFATLLAGLTAGALCWAVQGLSLWALLNAILPQPAALAGGTLALYAAFVALATLAGFLILLVPGGLGVRELVLQQLLAGQLASGGAAHGAVESVVAVLLLRLVWSIAEVTTAALLYWVNPVGRRKNDMLVRQPARDADPLFSNP